MSLFDRLQKKGKSDSATAIAAIPAIRDAKTGGNDSQNRRIARIAVAKPNNQNFADAERQTADLLALFRFDLMQEAIDAGSSPDELRRVNNMAWEFMQADGMGFDDAIRLAAEVVVYGHVAVCEAAYVDVMELFHRMRT